MFEPTCACVQLLISCLDNWLPGLVCLLGSNCSSTLGVAGGCCQRECRSWQPKCTRQPDQHWGFISLIVHALQAGTIAVHPAGSHPGFQNLQQPPPRMARAAAAVGADWMPPAGWDSNAAWPSAGVQPHAPMRLLAGCERHAFLCPVTATSYSLHAAEAGLHTISPTARPPRAMASYVCDRVPAPRSVRTG